MHSTPLQPRCQTSCEEVRAQVRTVGVWGRDREARTVHSQAGVPGAASAGGVEK